MAHLSQDKNLLEAFINNQDIHKSTASEVFDVPFKEVTSEQHRRAGESFGLIYGMSAFGLSKQLDIPRYEAQEYIDTYFERYPNVQNYMEQTRKKAAEHGYVETLLGRRLHLNDINASNRMRREAAERIPKVILEHHGLSKLQNAYIDKLPEMIHLQTQRVHTNYHQAVTATGRLSSGDPNLQNIPIRSAEGRRIRNAFIAPKGYKILAADYSQVELRIMAPQDKNVMKLKNISIWYVLF